MSQLILAAAVSFALCGCNYVPDPNAKRTCIDGYIYVEWHGAWRLEFEGLLPISCKIPSDEAQRALGRG